MQSLFRAAAIAALALPLAFAPLSAQDYQGALSLHGGWIWFSDFNENGEFDADLVDNVFDDDFDQFFDLSLDDGWVTGAQLEYWPRALNGRLGFRVNGNYTEHKFKARNILANEVDVDFGDVNVWMGDFDLMARILTPRRTRVWAPFAHIGIGAVHYNPAGEQTLVFPDANVVWGDDGILNGDDDFEDGGNAETELALAFGLGTDILPGWNLGNMGIGIRMEVADHYTFDSPADPLFTEEDFDGVHNVRATVGVLGTFGSLFPEERVAVAPAPPPPAPPAPPAEEAVTICVIDPAMTGMIGEVDAVYRPDTGDTLVVRNGTDVAFETAYPVTAPTYVRDANWYVAGDPITLDVMDREVEFVSFGSSRIVAPEDLAFIGTYRGTPVFADADDVRGIRDQLDDLRETDDLEDVLEERSELREELDELDVVYVPLESGCVFQPFRQVEEVRKVRG